MLCHKYMYVYIRILPMVTASGYWIHVLVCLVYATPPSSERVRTGTGTAQPRRGGTVVKLQEKYEFIEVLHVEVQLR